MAKLLHDVTKLSRFCYYFVPILWLFCPDFVTFLWLFCSFIKSFLLSWLDWLVVPLTTCHNSEPVIRVRVSMTIWPNFWLIYFSGTARKIMPIIKYEIFSMILSCCVVFKSLDLHNSSFWHMIDIFDPIKNMWQAAATNLFILTNNLKGNLMFHFSSTPRAQHVRNVSATYKLSRGRIF